jgi:hypothetical protein
MSYITNLVHRTLGVTPVAQPVIQAKFAPQSPTLSAAVQDSTVAQPAAPLSRGAHSLSTNEIGKLMPRPRMIDAHPEAVPAREGQGIESALPPVQVTAKLATSEREPVLPPAPRLEIPTPVSAARRFSIEAQTQELSHWHSNTAQPGDDFRLMKASLQPQAAQAFAPSPPAYSPGTLRSRAMESAEQPVVRVHIGRVDVRMVTTATKEPRAAIPAAQGAKPASLDDYLRARQRGTR